MDGLECSEIRMSDVCDTTTLRFDSDYYKKEYLEIEQFICKNRDKFVTIESQGLQVDASAFYPSLEPYYNTGTIPFVRVADVKDQIEYNACVNIPEMGEEFRTLHMCYPGDVVLTKGGRVGTAGLITQPSYVTRDLIFINASALSRKDYIVLYLFFSSSFAYKQMVRSSSMTAQPHLTITLIRDLLVCNYSNSFKDKVEKYFTTLEKLNHQAQILYSEAKQILIKELKVCTEGITSDSYTTKYLSTSFKVSGRLDAEYYQPKYDGYLSALEQFETTKIPNEFYRYVVGSTGIINIYDDDIAKIPIPILDGEIQKDIAEKVQNSFALRRQSKQLLEYAKQAVEMAIEQGEDAALVWLKETLALSMSMKWKALIWKNAPTCLTSISPLLTDGLRSKASH